MKRTEFNAITSGVSGAFGNQLVMRIINGVQVIGRFPSASKVPPTDKQKSVTERFKAATAYAKQVMKNLSLKDLYSTLRVGKGGVFATAVADYFHAPKIDTVILEDYNGTVGSKVLVVATDNVKVDSVAVQILTSGGNLLEEGQAAFDPDTGQWQYTATQQNEDLQGSVIVVTAKDLPGNETKSETVMA
ncbi:hypothetical protein MKQ68_10755 [Chitinophaga horti]|uniref:Uncharacterized protein n=1 Tax=Chitinophaga horti TaxID=2920382 RepID=A0ABY6J8C7_9BACT|nr:hypothetical protein [Chitinophaga horti]UYQ95581.1 hypothetical protein MKQ68_10755 [Chitinophaga horti]